MTYIMQPFLASRVYLDDEACLLGVHTATHVWPCKPIPKLARFLSKSNKVVMVAPKKPGNRKCHKKERTRCCSFFPFFFFFFEMQK